MTKPAPLDLAGIGIGPFNLSLAAQLDSIDGLDALFFDKQPAFDWHPGMMLPDVTLQTSFLKDLVTATNPTSPWSFVAYLVAHKRFYDFLNAEFEAIPRKEFAQYLAWVAGQLESLRFNTAIREVSFEGGAFTVRHDKGAHHARNLALGVGLKPHMPGFVGKLSAKQHFHSSQARLALADVAGKSIAVIGGGQSGAEIVLHLLNLGEAGPARIDWISQRPNFQPLDMTPFTNELFTPQYVARFHALPEPRRRATVEREKLAGDGISPSTLSAIYRRLYTLQHVEQGGPEVGLLPHREVLDVEQAGPLRLIMRNGFDGGVEITAADIIVLATGYAFALPDCLEPIMPMLNLDQAGRPRLASDFSIKWDGPSSNRIFALNVGLVSHGIAEPQLSLMAWRSAVIANALVRRQHFDVEMLPPMIAWSSSETSTRFAEL